MTRQMTITGPWPEELEDLCSRMRYHKGWSAAIEDGEHDDGQVTGPRLVIYVMGVDAYHPDARRYTSFHFPIPACTFNRASWQRWLKDRLDNVHDHENGEALGFVYERPSAVDGCTVSVIERPFAPLHGDGQDPHRSYEAGIHHSEVRVAQGYMQKSQPESLHNGRYRGFWWDGEHVHTDANHDLHDKDCVPVQLVNDAV